MSALLLAAVLGSAAAPDAVLVFPDRAQVTRTAQVQCGARVPVLFTAVPPAAAADSFRARVEGGTVDGLRAELVTQEKVFGPKTEQLRAQREALGLERATADDQRSRAQAQLRLGGKFEDLASTLVSREMAAERPDLRAWQAAFDAALGTGLGAARATAEADARLRELDRRLEQLDQQLAALEAQRQRQSYAVEVLVSCGGGSAAVSLTYLVGGASWTPAYEARSDDAAVDFSTYATLRQSTGEDWAQAAVILSTAVPSQNATPPELLQLKVSALEKQPEKKVLVRRDEVVDTARVAPSGDVETDGRLQAASQGLSVQLTVPERATVPGDGSPVRLFVGRTRMKAQFELRVLPKLLPVAFRVAELANQAPWPLLPGRVDAFRATGLVGRYQLERVAQGAAFTLTFGLEDQVRVKRKVMEELKRDAGLFNSKRRFTYSYRFELANYGKAPAEVTVADHLPVAEVDDVAVSVSDKTTPGYQLAAAEGVARWKLKLAPGEKRNVDFAFQVDVPQSYEMGGL